MVGVTGSNPVPPTTRESGTDHGAAFGFAPFVFPVTRTRRSAPWARRDSPGRHRAHGALLPQPRGILQAADLVEYEIGRANDRTPVTTAHIGCRPLIETTT